jgi:hypothetical protein
MEHKWNPKTDPVEKSEPIGRRLYEEPMLMGAQDQPSFKGLDYRHFEETRGDKELSLDRLGCTGVQRNAKNYLTPRAVAAGQKRMPSKQFNGWAHVRASVLEKGWHGQCYPVIASPIENGPEENYHHAHVIIQGDSISAALHLREMFTRHGAVEKVAPPEMTEPSKPASKAVGIWKIAGNLIGGLRRLLKV